MKIEGVKAPEPGRSVRVQGDGAVVAVFNIDGQLFGIDAKCPHAGGPLDRGRLDGAVVTCPLHGSQFDLRTGEVSRGPAIKPVRAYRVRVEGTGLVLEPAPSSVR